MHSSIAGFPPSIVFNVHEEMKPPPSSPPPPPSQMAAVKTQPPTPTHSPSYSLQNHTLIPELSSSLKRFTLTRLSALAPRRAQRASLCARTHSGPISASQARLLPSLITLKQQDSSQFISSCSPAPDKSSPPTPLFFHPPHRRLRLILFDVRHIK